MSGESDDDFSFDLWDELRPLIEHATTADARSQQSEIGPSGLGTPCVRKLAHRLADTPPVNSNEQAPWRPTVGRAVHKWIETEVFAPLNAREIQSPLHSSRGRCKAAWCDGEIGLGSIGTIDGRHHKLRYVTEFEVPVGTINGREINGHVDLYDRLRQIIVDWKIAGPKSLKDHHAHGMGDEYRVQQNTYAYGANRAGLPVSRIATCFLPMNGELRDGYVFAESYDPEIRREAFRRARIIEQALTEAHETDMRDTYGTSEAQRGDAGDESTEARRRFFRKLKTAPDYCHRCPWFSPGATDFEAACPGDPSIYDDADGMREFEGLI